MKRSIFQKVLCAAILLLLFVCLPVTAEAADLEGARQALIMGYEGNELNIDLYAYGLNNEQLSDLFWDLKDSGQLPWYAERYYYYHDNEGIVTSILPYNMDESVYNRTSYEEKVAEILAETVYPGMSDWQIALSIHDYLIAHFYYDETYTYYKGYDLMVGGTAVCDGYSHAYMDLLTRAGVPCRRIVSDAMNHSWNLVQIGGNWYHVDVTWDDPISDCYGRVHHNYFLLSDTGISDEDHNHYGWEADVSCPDTFFETDCFWLDSSSQICYTGVDTSYIRYYHHDNSYSVYRRNEQTAELTELAYFELGYVDIGYGHYGYPGNGLSLWNGRLYYSDMECVYSMNLDGSDKRTEFDLPIFEYYKVVCGSFVNDGTIYIYLRDHDGEYLTLTAPTLDTAYHTHTYDTQVIVPTCQRSGYTSYACGCGISFLSDHLAATDHSYGEAETIQPADTSHTGLVAYTCTTCGYQKTEETPMLEDTPIFDSSSYSDSNLFEEFFEDDDALFRLLAVAFFLWLFFGRKKKK